MTGKEDTVPRRLGRRYLIERRIASGGMGHVYRAYDRELEEPVALKVPLASHPQAAELRRRLRQEVRLAQKVSHPNVCRIFDLTVDPERDLTLLSMEFIEGETLHDLLGGGAGEPSRKDRNRIAYELCLGVAAIHQQDLIHRDLKPANVMIDGTGRTVILDLGLAEPVRAVSNPRSGTLLYMAPEQHAGEEVSQKSDLYALGLVLYELFTGKEPDPVAARNDLSDMLAAARSLPGEMKPTPIQPPLARQILRCLATDPDDRPASVDEVARTLPPPPPIPTEVDRLLEEPRGGLRPAAAWAGGAATLLGLLLVAWLSQHTQTTRAALSGLPPDELQPRAREILSRLGFEEDPRDRRSGFVHEPGSPEPIRYWVRQSPEPLARWRSGSALNPYGDPPFSTPGEVGVQLDPRGRLVRLDAVPEPHAVGRETDVTWSPLLRAAGFDPDWLEPASPEWIPPVFADRRAAWVETGRGSANPPRRIEAAAWRGRPVGFRSLPSPSSASRAWSLGAHASRRGTWPVATSLYCVGFGALLVGLLWLARRRLRERLADRSAAFRLAVFVFAVRSLVGLFGAPHRWSPVQLDLALAVFSRALLSAAVVWVVYVALEPWVRYYSPERSASWVRLVYGRLRDPLVGRDLLVGGLFGLGLLLWARLYALIPPRLGLPSPRPEGLSSLVGIVGQSQADLQAEALSSLPRAVGMALYAVVHGVLLSLVLIGVLVLLRRLLVSPWASRPSCSTPPISWPRPAPAPCSSPRSSASAFWRRSPP